MKDIPLSNTHPWMAQTVVIRKQLGISQAEVARRMGKNRSSIRQMERSNGKRMRFSTFIAYIHAMGCDLHWSFDGEHEA